MRRPRRMPARARLVGLVMALLLLAGRDAAAERYALLVGTTRYPSLPESRWLQGPENDVRLMKQVLEGRPFFLKGSQIATLAGWPDDPSQRPTRRNIERAFAEITARLQPGDQLFILLAGHGSQQPADADASDIEEDGLDEIFLPADAGEWDGSVGAVANAIVDDELRAWLDRVRKRGAFVSIVVDACQSGTMTRGAESSGARERGIPIEALVPATVLRTVTLRGSPRRLSTQPMFDLEPSSDLAALYAAQAGERTYEMRLPGATDPTHGLFTFTLAETIARTSSAITYRELVERVTNQYRALGRSAPTPGLEGSGLDREVFGQREWPERPRSFLDVDDATGSVVVDAGLLHGVRAGAVLEVFPPAGAPHAETSIGFVRVKAADVARATVEPFAFNGRAAPRTLVPGSRCRLALVEPADFTLEVALRHPAPPALTAAFRSLAADTQGLARPVAGSEPADVYLMSDAAGRIVLVRADTSASAGSGANTIGDGFVLSPRADGAGVARAVTSGIGRVARALNLLRLAALPIGDGTSDHSVAVGIELLRSVPSAGGTRSALDRPVEHGASGRVLRVGEHITFRLTNTGRVPAYVTLLCVDANFGITSVFPSHGARGDNLLKPGASIVTDVLEVHGESLGIEQVVAIAVDAADGRQDFGMLAQPMLERGRSGATARAPETALGRLLTRALNGVGPVRGLTGDEVRRYQIGLLSWRTEPKP